MTRRWRVRAAERPARRRANPPSSTTSSQALYRLRWLFYKKPSRAHAAAPPFPTRPALLGSRGTPVTPTGVAVFLRYGWIRRGAVVNDVPVARQSRD